MNIKPSMMYCRFENRLDHSALVLNDLIAEINAYEASDLPQVWASISAAQAQGHWIALVLNYELGAHLLGLPFAKRSQKPILCAYVMRQSRHTTPWGCTKQKPTLAANALIPRQQYLQHIAHIQQGIRNGDYYQVNYSIPIAIQTTTKPKTLYQYLAHSHPVSYGAYLSDGKKHLLSFSPELFVRRTGNHLTVKPMKGTTARQVDPQQDKAAAKALRQSEKDVAENIMIVDLLRNDLGRIATTGSVNVTKLLEVEAYPSVWTMTSTIEADVLDVTFAELMTALFPCGSITGTPKIAAMQCIQELEQRNRGIYCGSIGWLAPNGDLQLNVAIRTIEYLDDQTAQFGVGGAIVIDSDPAQEWEECLWKARVLNTDIQFEE